MTPGVELIHRTVFLSCVFKLRIDILHDFFKMRMCFKNRILFLILFVVNLTRVFLMLIKLEI